MIRQLPINLILIGAIIFQIPAFSKVKDNYEFAVLQAQSYSMDVIRHGKVKYLDEISLSFNTTGYLDKLTVDIGDKVKPGTVIAALEASELVYQAQALTYRLEYTEKEKRRINKLYQDGLLPKARVDAIEADYNQLNENLKQVTYRLLKSRLQSDVKGTVSARLVNRGELVTAGQPAVVIVPDENNLLATFWLTEAEIRNVNKGQKIQVVISDSKEVLEGNIQRIAITPDNSNLYRMDVALNKAVLAGSKVQITLNSGAYNVFAVSHHTPVAIKSNNARVIIKEGDELNTATMKVVAMDDDFIYLQALSPEIELVTNGWISR